MEIRVATREDAAAMVEFNQAMAQETEGKILIEDVLAKGVSAVFDDPQKGFYVVADEHGRIVGGLMVTFEWSDWRNGWFWYVQSVYVRPEARGKKVYSQLYHFVKERAAEQGNVCGFQLYVERENENAQRVYKSLGMEQTYYLMYEEMCG